MMDPSEESSDETSDDCFDSNDEDSEENQSSVENSHQKTKSIPDIGRKALLKKVRRLSVRFSRTSSSGGTDFLSQDTGHKGIPPVREYLGEIPRRTQVDTVSDNKMYNFNHTKRGIVAIIVMKKFENKNFNRKYAAYDIKIFEKIFGDLAFEIVRIIDKSAAELKAELEALRKKIDADCDCFVCLISSHGAEVPVPGYKYLRQHVVFTRNSTIETHSIIDLFNESNCPQLQGKPKLFFIQACRAMFNPVKGTDVDPGVFQGIGFPKLQSHNKIKQNNQSKQDGEISDNNSEQQLNSDANLKSVNVQNNEDKTTGSILDESKDLTNFVVDETDLLPFADDDGNESMISTVDRPQTFPEGFINSSAKKGYKRHKTPYANYWSEDIDFCTIPCYAHCLVMYSSVSEHIAWSDEYRGGWLPWCLSRVMEKLIEKNFCIDLLDVLTKVNGQMALTLMSNYILDKNYHKNPEYHNAKSTACIYHMLDKDIYIEPKATLIKTPSIMKETPV